MYLISEFFYLVEECNSRKLLICQRFLFWEGHVAAVCLSVDGSRLMFEPILLRLAERVRERESSGVICWRPLLL